MNDLLNCIAQSEIQIIQILEKIMKCLVEEGEPMQATEFERYVPQTEMKSIKFEE
jgi:hypothetical protein